MHCNPMVLWCTFTQYLTGKSFNAKKMDICIRSAELLKDYPVFDEFIANEIGLKDNYGHYVGGYIIFSNWGFNKEGVIFGKMPKGYKYTPHKMLEKITYGQFYNLAEEVKS